MRTTYEDLLRAVRRDATTTYNSAGIDTTDLIAGWQATLTAARHHFRWLRVELCTNDFGRAGLVAADGPFAALARSIGAGGDLLASQDRRTRAAWGDEEGLAAAREELASITDWAARAVVARLGTAQICCEDVRERLSRHLAALIAELGPLGKRGHLDVGALRGLTTTLPYAAVDQPSQVILLAARWQSAHLATNRRSVLTRDLRSTTAQLRTVIGYSAHLIALLGQYDATAEVSRELVQALRTAAKATQRLAHVWRTRLSDLNGRSEGPAESSFVELASVLRAWLSDGERLKKPQDVVPDELARTGVANTIDELMHSAHRVAQVQQETVAWLVSDGRLFVPGVELAKHDPAFSRQPQVWRLKHPQTWVWTNVSACFDEATAALADVKDHLAAAARSAQILAGTSDLRRPCGHERFVKPPKRVAQVATPQADTRSPRGRYRPEYWDLIPEIYRDLDGPER
ncbi:hypothetical protein ACWF0M_12685 [Kribbella sp. NPDC055110]